MWSDFSSLFQFVWWLFEYSVAVLSVFLLQFHDTIQLIILTSLYNLTYGDMDKNGWDFGHNILWYAFLLWIFFQFLFEFDQSLFVLKGPIDSKSALVQIMAWCYTSLGYLCICICICVKTPYLMYPAFRDTTFPWVRARKTSAFRDTTFSWVRARKT